MAIPKHSITINYHETTTSVNPDPEPEPTPESDTSSGKLITLGNLATFKEEMDAYISQSFQDVVTPEFSDATSYAVGDYVLYEGELYRCITATSGTWDATKWQLTNIVELVQQQITGAIGGTY